MIAKCILSAVFMSVVMASVSWAGKLNDQWTILFSERFRLETWDNAITLDETAEGSRTYTRNRTQLGVTWSPSPNTVFGLRLANEFRYYLAPTNVDFHLNEVFIDQLYLKTTMPWYRPLAITVGRQDIMLGEGFMVMDGNPLDGSRSIYFNAVRVDWAVRPDHQVIAFASHQEETDDWLPIIHEQDQALVEQPETGIGVFYNGKWSQRELQAYVVHKKRSDNTAFPINSTATTIGGRIKGPLAGGINLTAVLEAGYQFGSIGDADRRAFGGHGYVQYCPDWGTQRPYLPSLVAAGIVYLSGDDPGTAEWEGWDPMFARWPKWSESYIYTQIREDAVAWWTNLVSCNAEARFLLTPAADLKLIFHHLMAPRSAGISSGFPGGTGTTRGDLFIGKLSYKFDQRWSGHVLGESFTPGDYYFNCADNYVWVRAELMYQY